MKLRLLGKLTEPEKPLFQRSQGRFKADLPDLKAVDNLSLSTTRIKVNSDHIWIRKDICERYLIIVKAQALETEPHLEVTKDPRSGSGYIARLTSHSHPISVFEPVPTVVFEDDRMDHSIYWFGCRKRLKVKLRKLESAFT